MNLESLRDFCYFITSKNFILYCVSLHFSNISFSKSPLYLRGCKGKCYFYFVKFYLIYFSNFILTDSIVLEFLSNLTLHLFKELFLFNPHFLRGCKGMRLFYFVKFYLKYFLFLFSNLTTLKTFANLYFNELFFFPFFKGMQR